MSRALDRNRTLDELDPPAWGQPKYESYLVTTCHGLRRKPLRDFSTEDLRIMIGQGIGLRWLVPLALEALEEEPLAAGDFYPGDLLAAVLRARPDFWSHEPECHARIKAVLARVSDVPKEVGDAVAAFHGGADAQSMPELLAEVERFRSWATTYPTEQRGGEWECGYENWDRLYAAVLALVDQKPFASWSADELSAVLYAVARDNELEHLSRQIRERAGDDLLLDLAEASLRVGEPEARWQLAAELGYAPTGAARRDQLLLMLARDENEYVRRRSLQSLARLGSSATEQVALEAWSRPDESQQWARMMALWALHRVGSAWLEPLLAEAERDERPYLSGYAAKVRSGDVDP